MAEKPLLVTAALLRHNHKILIAQRKSVGRFANKWEFPGGKIDPGETPQQCLRRELQEELGLETTVGALFSDTLYDHDQGQIRQFTYWVDFVTPPVNIELSEHQSITWITPAEIINYEFAGADVAVAEKFCRENPVIG